MVLVALLALCAIVVAVVALMRVNALDRIVVEQQVALRSLGRQTAALTHEKRVGTAPSEVQQRTRTSEAAATAAELAKPAAPPAPEPAPISAKPAAPQRPVAPPAPPVAPVPPAPPTAAERPSPPQAVPVLQSAVPPRPLPTPPGTPDPLAASQPPSAAFDWEDLVGVKLFSWVAAIALALGVILFLRYSIQAGWLQPPIQMAIGIVVGLALLVGCEFKVARNYPVTANALDASGVVILFSTFFAAFARWHLIPGGAAFLFLILVTAVAVLLSIRRDSLFIAVLGLIGGFLTPALLSTGQDNPVGLFGYLLVLNAGLAWVAYRKRWALLTAVSLAVTTLYQWSWVAKFLTDEKLGLAAGIFLVFPVLGFVSLALGRRNSDRRSPDLTFSLTANIGGLLPLLFAVFLAAVPAYGAHTGLLFGFLVCIDAGLLAVSLANPASDLLHLAGALSTNVIFLAYLAASYTSAAWPGILGFVALFVLFYLGAPLFARRLGRPFVGTARYASLGSGVLLFTFPLLIALEPATASPALVFTVLFVLLAAISAFALFGTGLKTGGPTPQDGHVLRGTSGLQPGSEHLPAIHFVGAFFALVAETVWSANFLTQPRLLAALIVYLVFALFYIGVPVLARWLGRPLQPHGAGVTILLVSLALLFFPAGLLASDTALWGLALLLAILNVAVFVEGVAIRWPVVSLASSVLSWLVIATWWARASEGSLTGPGLLVVAAFTILTIGGHIWNATHSDRTNPAAQNGVYLGLVGHLFLLFVAGQPALSIPPWPMLGVLLVLDLAVGAAALYLRQASLHLSAIVASALVVLAWLSHAVDAPWPATAIIAAGVLAALAVAWMRLARATGTDAPFIVRIDAGGAVGLLLAQVVAMFASAMTGTPGVAMLTFAHAAFAGGLLGVAAFRRWHVLALLGVAPYAVSLALWQSAHPDPTFWLSLLAFAGCVYAVFLAYPLLLGRRAGSSIEPYEAAILASAVFFFAARHSLVAGGFGDVIGILPVFQALLMAGLLWNVLRLEAAGARTIGRLALVAGAALAFITVAIPLQLDKEWITIGWALEGAALVWLYRRIPHRGLLVASTALLAIVFVRLALNPAVFEYQARGAYLLWNWYLYTYLVSAGALLLSARLFGGTDDVLMAAILPRARSLVAAGGTVLLFWLLNIEIADAYSTGPNITFDLGGSLAQGMTYTLGWGVFAVALLVSGIVIHSRPARFAALALLVVTVLKGFLYDLSTLGGLYRVFSFVGLAICLALVAVVLQKFVLRPPERKVHESVR